MLSFKKLLITKNSSILDAVKVIDSTNHRICFIIDKSNKLIGSVTDGDIRRGLIKKISFKKKAIKICNKKTIFLNQYKKSSIKFDNNEETCIPIIDKRKRIIGVKIYNKKKNKINSALIMAGGKGERLYPITKNVPKPLVKVKGKTLLESLIKKLNADGVKNIRISVYHMFEKVKSHLKNKKFSIKNIDYIVENKPLGTGGSIKLFNLNDKDFFVVNCDIKLNIDFSKVANFHLDQKADITVVSKQIINKLSFGKLNINSKFNVTSIEEKPILINYISTGLYIINKKIKKLINTNQKINMDEIIQNAIIKKMKVISYPLYEDWTDIGTIKDLNKFKRK
jgi:dTDP-glucose pyrophosphorylase